MADKFKKVLTGNDEEVIIPKNEVEKIRKSVEYYYENMKSDESVIKRFLNNLEGVIKETLEENPELRKEKDLSEGDSMNKRTSKHLFTGNPYRIDPDECPKCGVDDDNIIFLAETDEWKCLECGYIFQTEDEREIEW